MDSRNWFSLVKETPYLGRAYPDTYNFTDIPKLEEFKNQKIIPEMKQFDVYHDGRVVFGYEVIYRGLTKEAY